MIIRETMGISFRNAADALKKEKEKAEKAALEMKLRLEQEQDD